VTSIWRIVYTYFDDIQETPGFITCVDLCIKSELLSGCIDELSIPSMVTPMFLHQQFGTVWWQGWCIFRSLLRMVWKLSC